jgi:hypothetical protein
MCMSKMALWYFKKELQQIKIKKIKKILGA